MVREDTISNNRAALLATAPGADAMPATAPGVDARANATTQSETLARSAQSTGVEGEVTSLQAALLASKLREHLSIRTLTDVCMELHQLNALMGMQVPALNESTSSSAAASDSMPSAIRDVPPANDSDPRDSNLHLLASVAVPAESTM